MYEKNGLTDDVAPEETWTAYDAMAQCFGEIGDRQKEIEFYEKAISLLTRLTTASEV